MIINDRNKQIQNKNHKVGLKLYYSLPMGSVSQMASPSNPRPTVTTMSECYWMVFQHNNYENHYCYDASSKDKYSVSCLSNFQIFLFSPISLNMTWTLWHAIQCARLEWVELCAACQMPKTTWRKKHFFCRLQSWI